MDEQSAIQLDPIQEGVPYATYPARRVLAELEATFRYCLRTFNMPDRNNTTRYSRAQALGTCMARQRHRLNMSGAEVARQAGIGEKRYNNYENGVRLPDLMTLQKICAVLGTTIDELVSAELHLLQRDKETYDAMVRFHEACTELFAADVQMLANIAEVSRNRRRAERMSPQRLTSGLQDLAFVHERLVPSIIRTHRPQRIETHTEHTASGEILLWIFVDYPPEKDPGTAVKALLTLAKERLSLPATALEITQTEKTARAVEVILKVLCGAQRGEMHGQRAQ